MDDLDATKAVLDIMDACIKELDGPLLPEEDLPLQDLPCICDNRLTHSLF